MGIPTESGQIKNWTLSNLLNNLINKNKKIRYYVPYEIDKTTVAERARAREAAAPGVVWEQQAAAQPRGPGRVGFESLTHVGALSAFPAIHTQRESELHIKLLFKCRLE